jgi:hypothetical protein
MLRLISKTTITSKKTGKEYYFDFCEGIEINTSFETFTDTASIRFPRKLTDNGKNIFVGDTALFRRGDKVKIELGYDPKLRTVFNGYITEIGSNIPIELKCEDEMFVLKNTRITYPEKVGVITHGKPSKKYPEGRVLKKPIIVSDPISLYQLVDYMIPDDIEFECLDVNLGSFRATNASVTQILDELKKDYGFYSYFRSKDTTVGHGLEAVTTTKRILHVGLPSDASISNTEEFAFEENIINQDDLKYQQADDLILKVVAISMQSDNSKKQVEVGDADGSQRTYHTYNATDSDLKKFAQLKLDAVKYTGYVGNIRTFGEPYMRHGDIAKITSTKLPERDGNYEVTSVKRIFSVSEGYKQELELGIKVASSAPVNNNIIVF